MNRIVQTRATYSQQIFYITISLNLAQLPSYLHFCYGSGLLSLQSFFQKLLPKTYCYFA
jgi:hypothetical protein